MGTDGVRMIEVPTERNARIAPQKKLFLRVRQRDTTGVERHSVITSPVLLPALFILAAVTSCALAAEDPSTLNVDSPEVLADHSVVFRIEAPKANDVKVRGIQRQLVQMTKDKRGVWSVTLGPISPGIYGYSFIVDGEAIIDPSNPEIKPERDPDESELEILSAKPPLTQWQDVPHGTVHLHDYMSVPLKRVRRMRVYTPPGYEADAATRYPVLYLLHGTGDTEATWTEFGRANYISDNLLSQTKTRPMLIVMIDGHADLRDEEGIGPKNLERIEADIVESVVPFVDRTYRTDADAVHRAICGLSMGGFQSFFTGLRNPDRFAWVAGMSAYVPDAEKLCAKALKNPEATNAKLRLLWHQTGKDDYLITEQRKFEAVLEKHHIKRFFHVTEGDHSWPVWRGYLGELLPLLFR